MFAQECGARLLCHSISLDAAFTEERACMFVRGEDRETEKVKTIVSRGMSRLVDVYMFLILC